MSSWGRGAGVIREDERKEKFFLSKPFRDLSWALWLRRLARFRKPFAGLSWGFVNHKIAEGGPNFPDDLCLPTVSNTAREQLHQRVERSQTWSENLFAGGCALSRLWAVWVSRGRTALKKEMNRWRLSTIPHLPPLDNPSSKVSTIPRIADSLATAPTARSNPAQGRGRGIYNSNENFQSRACQPPEIQLNIESTMESKYFSAAGYRQESPNLYLRG